MFIYIVKMPILSYLKVPQLQTLRMLLSRFIYLHAYLFNYLFYYFLYFVTFRPPTDCGDIGSWAGISLNLTVTSNGVSFSKYQA